MLHNKVNSGDANVVSTDRGSASSGGFGEGQEVAQVAPLIHKTLVLKENHIMPEEVTFDSERHLMRVRSWGKCTIQDWESSKAQVLQLNSEHVCDKLLVDVRDQDAAPEAGAVYFFGTNWPNSIRAAVLGRPATLKAQNFLGMVARNRGIPIMVFTDEAEATEWLNR